MVFSKLKMRKIYLLDFLNFEESVSVRDIADHFGVSLRSVCNPLTALNLQGLVRKVHDDNGVLTFSISEAIEEIVASFLENEGLLEVEDEGEE